MGGFVWSQYTVGFHNFNLRIFNLRVSNPNKLIVDAFLTRCRISMCQGLGPKNHDDISEIDRNCFPVDPQTPALEVNNLLESTAVTLIVILLTVTLLVTLTVIVIAIHYYYYYYY